MSRAVPIRVAELFDADPDRARTATRRSVPVGVTGHVAGTRGGTVVTGESVLSERVAGRRTREVQRLRVLLTAPGTELESAAAALVGAGTPDRGGREC